jgi:hypothetical protein
LLRSRNYVTAHPFLAPRYITSDSQSKHIEEDILLFTQGFLCFPIPWQWTGSGLSKAIAAQQRLAVTLTGMVTTCRAYIVAGGEPVRALCSFRSLCRHLRLPARFAAARR